MKMGPLPEVDEEGNEIPKDDRPPNPYAPKSGEWEPEWTDHGAAAIAFFKEVLGEENCPDVTDEASLRVAMMHVNSEIASAKADIVSIIDDEHDDVMSALGAADELRRGLDELREAVSTLPLDEVLKQLDSICAMPKIREEMVEQQARQR